MNQIVELSGQGRRFVFRLKTVPGEGGQTPVTFVEHIVGDRGVYIGVYRADAGWVTLTRGSRYEPTSEVVRAIRYCAGLLWSGNQPTKGFRLDVQEEPESDQGGGELREGGAR